MYLFTHKPGYSRYPVSPPGGTHEEELLFAWGDPWMDRPVNKVVSYTDSEKQLSRTMVEYWTNFARTGLVLSHSFFRENRNNKK
jgi:carboxylesterase type B